MAAKARGTSGGSLKSLPRMAIDLLRRGASADEAEEDLLAQGVSRAEARRAVGVAEETIYRRRRSRAMQEIVGGAALAILGSVPCLLVLGVLGSAGVTSPKLVILCVFVLLTGLGMIAHGWSSLPTYPEPRDYR